MPFNYLKGNSSCGNTQSQEKRYNKFQLYGHGMSLSIINGKATSFGGSVFAFQSNAGI